METACSTLLRTLNTFSTIQLSTVLSKLEKKANRPDRPKVILMSQEERGETLLLAGETSSLLWFKKGPNPSES